MSVADAKRRAPISAEKGELELLARSILHDLELVTSFKVGALETDFRMVLAVVRTLTDHEIEYDTDDAYCGCDCDVCAMADH